MIFANDKIKLNKYRNQSLFQCKASKLYKPLHFCHISTLLEYTMFAVDWKQIDCSFRFEFFRSFRCCSFHFTGRFQIFHSNAFKQRKMRMMKMKWIFSEEAIFYLSYSAVRPFVISNARRLKHVSCHRDATWGWEGRGLGGFWSGSLVLSSWSAGSKNKTFLNIRLWLQPSDQWRGVSCVWVCASVCVCVDKRA